MRSPDCPAKDICKGLCPTKYINTQGFLVVLEGYMCRECNLIINFKYIPNNLIPEFERRVT